MAEESIRVCMGRVIVVVSLRKGVSRGERMAKELGVHHQLLQDLCVADFWQMDV